MVVMKNKSYKKVSKFVLMMGRYIENVEEVPCGNTFAILGIDDILKKSGTISTSELAFSITPMKFSVSPVVRRSVIPDNISKLPKYVTALKRLSKSDPCLQVIIKDDEYIIAGAGMLHIEVALNDLKEFLDFNEELSFTVGDPIVEYCESVSEKSSIICLAKSPNGLNRLFVTAEPISSELIKAIKNNEIPIDDPKELSKILVNNYGWDSNDSKKIWYWNGTNCICDQSKAVPYLTDVKESIRSAFEWVVEEGALCGEPLTGIKFNIIDAVLHRDSSHRGQSQIVPAARRAFLAAQLSASPCIYEPVYLVEIQTEIDVVSKIYGLISSKRGYVFEEQPKIGSPLVNMKAYLPVMESFKFVPELCECTSGRAFTQMMFDHYDIVKGDPYENDNLSSKIIKTVRQRKKLKDEIPELNDYNDKL